VPKLSGLVNLFTGNQPTPTPMPAAPTNQPPAPQFGDGQIINDILARLRALEQGNQPAPAAPK
jgi:hypothetical protein